MSKVSALDEDGLELFFNSSDHLPPHFDVERPGELEVRIFFLNAEDEMVVVKWKHRKPSGKVLRHLCAAPARVRPALLAEWEQKVVVSILGEEQ